MINHRMEKNIDKKYWIGLNYYTSIKSIESKKENNHFNCNFTNIRISVSNTRTKLLRSVLK